MVSRLKFIIEGTLGQGNEEAWSVGLHFRPPPGDPVSPSAVQGWCDNIVGAASTVFGTSLLQRLSTSGRITQVRANLYGDTGPAVYSGLSIFPSPLQGTGSITLPPQASVCVSLITGVSGRRFRGRFYWPALTGSMSNNLKFDVPAGTAIAYATMLTEIATRFPGDVDVAPVVYSQASDVLTPVSAVRVGDVLDTQRRRRDALTELFQQAPVGP